MKRFHGDMEIFQNSGLLVKVTKTKLKKTFSANRKNFRAEVLVDDHKPFTIRYVHKRMKVIVNCHYRCWNNFGYGFHS